MPDRPRDPFAVATDPFADVPDPFDRTAPPERQPRQQDAARIVKLDRLRRPAPDELDQLEQEAEAEVQAMADALRSREAFIARRYRENARMDRVLITDYWCCLVFEDHERLAAFLRHLPADAIHGQWYLDGHRVAAHLGLDVPPPSGEWPQAHVDPTWDAFVADEELAWYGSDEDDAEPDDSEER